MFFFRRAMDARGELKALRSAPPWEFSDAHCDALMASLGLPLTSMKGRTETLKWIGCIAGLGVFCALLTFFFTVAGNALDLSIDDESMASKARTLLVCQIVLGASFGVLLLLALLGSAADWSRNGMQALWDELLPLGQSNDDRCQALLNLTKSHVIGRELRDQVLQRGLVFRGMHHRWLIEAVTNDHKIQEERRQQEERAQACKELHGLMTPSGARDSAVGR